MIVFWLICVSMLAIALFILLPPFFQKSTEQDVDRNSENIKIARQRLAELQRDVDTGVIALADFTAARGELEQTLLIDLDGTVESGHSHSHPFSPALVAMLLPMAVIALYFVVGTPSAFMSPSDSIAMLGSEPFSEQTKARIQIDTGFIEAQLKLAEEHMATKRFSEAAAILETLHTQAGDHPVILVRNANALAMADNGNLEGRPLSLVMTALSIDPKQPQGLWLAGMAAFQRNDNQSALQFWRRLEPLMKQQNPDALSGIQKLIAQAELKMADQVAPVINKTVGIVANASLQVRVKLEEGLSDRVSPEDRLFVFVQSLAEPSIPLAVVSKQVKDLPLTVTLNDSMAMLPEMRLSNFEDVRIGARISRSGEALPNSGDFQGELSPVRIAEVGIVEVIISTIIP